MFKSRVQLSTVLWIMRITLGKTYVCNKIRIKTGFLTAVFVDKPVISVDKKVEKRKSK